MQETKETWVHSLGWEDPLKKEGNGNLLQYSCLENPVDRGAWGGCGLQGHKEQDMTEAPQYAQYLTPNCLMSECFINSGGEKYFDDTVSVKIKIITN